MALQQKAAAALWAWLQEGSQQPVTLLAMQGDRLVLGKKVSPLWGSNPRPYAYEAHALPAELRRLSGWQASRGAALRKGGQEGVFFRSCGDGGVFCTWAAAGGGAPSSPPLLFS